MPGHLDTVIYKKRDTEGEVVKKEPSNSICSYKDNYCCTPAVISQIKHVEK